jgi:hypothetical protein
MDINIAPIITAVEFTFNPIDATTIAQAKIHKLETSEGNIGLY